MTISKKITNYIFDNNFKINLTDKYINIINYDEIIDFSPNKISIKVNNKTIIIEGYNLLIKRMENNEVLITGAIININITS